MPERPYDLPPMSSLVSFEAAARHVSFKAAARELNVTPAAISHQVKSLERTLRCTLFRRHHRGVDLTETGAYLLVALQRGFETMNDALDQLRSRAPRAAVTIRATTAVSALWLTPRLAEFWRTHGHVSVSQIVADTDPSQADCDLSIHYGDMSSETGLCHTLFHDRIMALASPGFARKHRIASVQHLARMPLIHLDAAETGWTDWRDWCSALGYEGPLNAGLRVNNYMIALQAAQDDMGAVLGWDGLTSGFLESGRLVSLLPVAVPSPLDFYVKLHPQASPKARLLFDWLIRPRPARHALTASRRLVRCDRKPECIPPDTGTSKNRDHSQPFASPDSSGSEWIRNARAPLRKGSRSTGNRGSPTISSSSPTPPARPASVFRANPFFGVIYADHRYRTAKLTVRPARSRWAFPMTGSMCSPRATISR